MAALIVGVAPWSVIRLEGRGRLVGALERRCGAPPATLDVAEVAEAVAEAVAEEEVEEAVVAVVAVEAVEVEALRADPESSPVQWHAHSSRADREPRSLIVTSRPGLERILKQRRTG
jgi:hypothetical protein